MPFDIPKLVRKDTAPFTFTFPGKTITLHTRPLTLETREVFNDAFRERGDDPFSARRERLSAGLERAKASGDPAAVEVAQAQVDALAYDEREHRRVENLNKLARLCVTSWDGVDAECTSDNVLALLKEIDEAGYREEITAYILWAQNPLNFRAPLVEASKVGEG